MKYYFTKEGFVFIHTYDVQPKRFGQEIKKGGIYVNHPMLDVGILTKKELSIFVRKSVIGNIFKNEAFARNYFPGRIVNGEVIQNDKAMLLSDKYFIGGVCVFDKGWIAMDQEPELYITMSDIKLDHNFYIMIPPKHKLYRQFPKLKIPLNFFKIVEDDFPARWKDWWVIGFVPIVYSFLKKEELVKCFNDFKLKDCD